MAELVGEAATMKHFDHPNVLKLLAVCVDSNDDEMLRVVLPYMANGDLNDFLKQSRVDPMNISEYKNVCFLFLYKAMCCTYVRTYTHTHTHTYTHTHTHTYIHSYIHTQIYVILISV